MYLDLVDVLCFLFLRLHSAGLQVLALGAAPDFDGVPLDADAIDFIIKYVYVLTIIINYLHLVIRLQLEVLTTPHQRVLC